MPLQTLRHEIDAAFIVVVDRTERTVLREAPTDRRREGVFMGRNRINSFEEWVALDLKYIDNWSLWLDLKILLITIPAVLFSKGAS